MGAIPIGIAAGAGLGLIKQNQQKAEFNRQKELAASMEQYSPWTGVHGQMPTQKPNSFDNMLGGAVGGGMMGMNIAAMGNQMPGVSPDPNDPRMGMQPMQQPTFYQNQTLGKSNWSPVV